MHTIDPPALLHLLAAIRGRRIAVVGDLMLDRYIWGSVSRISPEAPVPIVEVESESSSLGGAANVSNNVHSLGAEAIPIGIIGDDANGVALLELARNAGFQTSGVLVDPSRPTTVKTRIIAHEQHVVRIDRERKAPLASPLVSRLIEHLRNMAGQLDAIIIEDYNKGLLTQEFIGRLTALAREHNIPVTVDPKFDHFLDYRGVTVFKPNRKETEEALGIRIGDAAAVRDAAERLQKHLQAQHILITLGSQGMHLLDSAGRHHSIPTQARRVHDVSGAGDTVIGTLTAALAAGAAIFDAASLANFAAGVVIAELGAVPVSQEKLKKAIQRYERERNGETTS